MTPDASTLAAAWDRDAATVTSTGAGVAISLDHRDFLLIERGEPISHRLETPEGTFALGAVWVPAPVAATWIATQDAGDRPLSSSHHEWLPGATPTSRHTYMRIDLPWPVKDRQWVAEFRANGALYAASEGRVWQRSWALADAALALHPDPEALWVDEAVGAWTLVDLGDSTLAIFAVRTVLGGSIPQGLSQSYAVSTIKGTLAKLAVQATTVPEHYGADHAPMYKPDGERLPVHLGE